MLQNYLKIAFRNLRRNKLFSLVNIVGLSLSMAVGIGMLINLKEGFETDHFHPFLDRTFRVLTDASTPEGRTRWATTPQPVAAPIRQMSMVEEVVQVRQGGSVRVLTDRGEIAVNTAFTEPSFFRVFGFSLATGNASTALQSPQTVLLSQRVASRLFGEQNAVGQTVLFDGLGRFAVAGIIQEPPLRTHLPVEAVFSLQAARSLEKAGRIPVLSDQWADYKTTATYALLKSADDAATFSQLVGRMGQKPNAADHQTALAFSAQPIEDITPWNPAIQNDRHAGMNWTGIRQSLFLIAALTLLAAFNYTSLSLARSLTRAKEVGIRKASGALGRQILGQFLTESTIIALFSLLVGLILWHTVVNSGWLPESEGQASWPDIQLLSWLLLYALLTGVVAGGVPAGLLSRLQPVQVLRNLQTVRLFQSVGFYRVLIVIQFAVTTMLMVFLVVLRDAGIHTSDQLRSVLPTNVVLLSLRGVPAETVKPQLEQLSQVRRVTATSQVAIYPATIPCTLQVAGTSPKAVFSKAIDENYVSVFGLTMQAGRNLPPNLSPTQEQYVLVNEQLARQLPGNKPETAVGQRIRIDSVDVQIAGVLAEPDAQLSPIPPTVYRYKPAQASLLALETEPGSESAVLEASRRIWQDRVPDRLPEVYQYDEKINEDFQKGLGTINLFFGFFCGLVMLVACLGILGISAYAVEVRIREIGIRRTLGASSGEVIWTLSKTFVKLLLWAGVFGLPAGWFCGKLLRDRMASGVDLGPVNLLVGFGLVVLVGGLTVLSQTARATRIKPADVLRGE
ncbi:ABC transporter permease [Larkinella insperata]|uniref:ABC transporter permease n=1 Tax=Larkinella insperata TaxID=332158 RepID=A0ABW3QMX9_9BACT|nr:ABC transporter permease [Larkinella insperata]